LPLQRLAGSAGLQHHQAHAVGDDVVELARDACSLVGDRGLDLLLTLGLQLRRSCFEPVTTQHAVAKSLAEGPGDRVEHPLAECLVEAARQRRAVAEQLVGDDDGRASVGPAARCIRGRRVHDEDLGQEGFEQVRAAWPEEVVDDLVHPERAHRQPHGQERVPEPERQAGAHEQ